MEHEAMGKGGGNMAAGQEGREEGQFLFLLLLFMAILMLMLMPLRWQWRC